MNKDYRKNKLKSFITQIGVNIKNINLLDTALTHGSYIKDNNLVKVKDNERLEFFGDAVLKLFISEYLMKEFPDYSEGKLSAIRAYLVSEKVLTAIAKKLQIKNYLLLGKNEKKNLSDSIPSDALEAVLAVIYYSCGEAVTRKFILNFWKEHIEYACKTKGLENYKAVLQEFTQANNMGLPEYSTITEKGPDHKKEFEVAVYLLGKEIARGQGKTKKEASQNAAMIALTKTDQIRLLVNKGSNGNA